MSARRVGTSMHGQPQRYQLRIDGLLKKVSPGNAQKREALSERLKGGKGNHQGDGRPHSRLEGENKHEPNLPNQTRWNQELSTGNGENGRG